jgi:hypothetical protein
MSIRRSELFTHPASDVEQLSSVVIGELDKVTPVHRRAFQPDLSWLSAKAVAAKQERRRVRRLESGWRTTRDDNVHMEYRRARRSANILISKSHWDHYRQRLGDRVFWQPGLEVARRARAAALVCRTSNDDGNSSERR